MELDQVQKTKWFRWTGGLMLTLFLLGIVALLIGSVDLDVVTVWKAIFGMDVDEGVRVIVWDLRFPRVCLSALVGGALALSGVIFQALLRNPLADPYILGISSGSSLGAVCGILIGWGSVWLSIWTVPVYALMGACLATLLVLILSKSRYGLKAETLILSGVVVQSFLGAVLAFAISISPEQMTRIQFWLMGSFTLREWDHVVLVFPFLLLSFLCAWLFYRELNLFSLGDRCALHVGVAVFRIRLFLLIVASVLTGVAVSVSGTIGFVGLIIPHIMRILTGANHQTLVPLSLLGGAIFLVGADLLARTLMAPIELPIGVITAFVGAPFFAMLLKKKRFR